jgi:hypothetical protein
LEEIIHQEMEQFREELDENDQQANGSNSNKVSFSYLSILLKQAVFFCPKIGIFLSRNK